MTATPVVEPPKLPRRESVDHFMLKQVGTIWLYGRGFRFTATEVAIPVGWRRYHTLRPSGRKVEVADVVGLRRKRNGWEVGVVEVKVSRNDFQSGFSTAGNLNYVLTPPGLLIPSEIPEGVGLVECDWQEFRWRGGHSFRGIKVVKRAKCMALNDRLGRPNDEAVFRFLLIISGQLVTRAIYQSPWLTDMYRS